MTAAPRPSEADVTVVVVTYNSADVIGRCLGALPAAAPVVVVDNASVDDTATAARAARADATVIAQPRNEGFARACNAGLAGVATSFAAIVNPDMFLAPDALSVSLGAMAAHPRAGVIGLGGASRGPVGALTDVVKVEGSFMLLRMEAVRALGGFDEALFMYFEDHDLCVRAAAAGWRVALAAGAKGEHLRNGSTAPRFDDVLEKRRIHGMAAGYFIDKHAGSAPAAKSAAKMRKLPRRIFLCRLVGRWRRARLMQAGRDGLAAYRANGPAAMFDNKFTIAFTGGGRGDGSQSR